jgi:hypothetical protein
MALQIRYKKDMAFALITDTGSHIKICSSEAIVGMFGTVWNAQDQL